MFTSGLEGLIKYNRIALLQSWSWRNLSPVFDSWCFYEWIVVIPIHWPDINIIRINLQEKKSKILAIVEGRAEFDFIEGLILQSKPHL